MSPEPKGRLRAKKLIEKKLGINLSLQWKQLYIT
jgi:hypothetical protein